MSQDGVSTISDEATATPPRDEVASPEWLSDAAELIRDFKAGAADHAKAVDGLKELQSSRHDRNKFFDHQRGLEDYTPREIRAAHRSYERCMDVVKAQGWIGEAQSLNDELMDLMTFHSTQRALAASQGRVHEIRMPNGTLEPYQGGIRQFARAAELRDLVTKAAGDFWDTANADQGSDWVPTGYSVQTVPFERLPLNVASAFPSRPIPRGMGTLRIPVISARASVDAAAESTGNTSFSSIPGVAEVSSPQSAYIELTPTYKFRGTTAFSREMTEDSVVEIVGTHRSELVLAMGEGFESCIINGDSADFGDTSPGGDLDGANRAGVGAGNANQVFYGLRHYCFFSDTADPGNARGSAFSTSVGGALTADWVHTARKNMGKFAAILPSRMRLIVSPTAFFGLVDDEKVKTIDVYGSQATIVTGELARIWGIPIIVSEWMPENLATTGRNNSGAGSTTAAILTRPDRYRLGIKRQLETIMIPALADDAMFMRAFFRVAFDHAPPDTDTHTWGLHNIT